MGAALTMVKEHRAAIMQNYRERNGQLRLLLKDIPGAVINSPENGCPHILNFSFPGIPSEVMLHALEERGVYVSSGSACSKGALSGVLKAFRLPDERVRSALRVSFSRETTAEEIDAFAEALREVTGHLSAVVNG